MNSFYDEYKNEPEMLVARADREGNITLLEEIFLKDKELDIFYITPYERWNWLHQCNLNNSYITPLSVVEFYIQQGIEINAQDIYGMTPLHYAMRAKNVDAAIALLKAGADPNIPNNENLIPLRMCIRYPERLDLLELMLKNGGDVHYFDGNNNLLDAIKEFKGNDPEPKYRKFIEKLEEYA